MTTRRVTARRTSLEKHQDEVIALLLTGSTAPEIAAKYKVQRESVWRFMKRHEDRLAALQQAVTKQVEDYAIAHQVNRVAELQFLYDLTRNEVDEFGVTIVERRIETQGKGDDAIETVIETRDYRASLVKEARGLLHQAAEELGQLPKGDGAHASASVVNIVRVGVPDLNL